MINEAQGVQLCSIIESKLNRCDITYDRVETVQVFLITQLRITAVRPSGRNDSKQDVIFSLSDDLDRAVEHVVEQITNTTS